MKEELEEKTQMLKIKIDINPDYKKQQYEHKLVQTEYLQYLKKEA